MNGSCMFDNSDKLNQDDIFLFVDFATDLKKFWNTYQI